MRTADHLEIMYVWAAHHLEITCRSHQSQNGTPGQSGNETNGFNHKRPGYKRDLRLSSSDFVPLCLIGV